MFIGSHKGKRSTGAEHAKNFRKDMRGILDVFERPQRNYEIKRRVFERETLSIDPGNDEAFFSYAARTQEGDLRVCISLYGQMFDPIIILPDDLKITDAQGAVGEDLVEY